MKKIIFVIIPLMLLAMVISFPAQASAITYTQTFHNEPFPIYDLENPCYPAIGEGVVNGVFHGTGANTGSGLGVHRYTGSFEVFDLGTDQNATGHFTIGVKENVIFVGQGQIRNSLLRVQSVNGILEDGSIYRFNYVTQIREVDGIPTLFFVKTNCHES
jgi:hypothetical protein